MPAPKSFTKIMTDETLLETAQHGSLSFPLQYYYEDIWDFDFHCVDWHWHPELEFIYVATGSATCLLDQEKVIVTAGQGILINSRVIHRLDASSSTTIPNIVFSPTLLAAEESLLYQRYIEPVLKSSLTHLVLSPETSWQAVCLQKLREVFACLEKEEIDVMRVTITLLCAWHDIYHHCANDGSLSQIRQDSTAQIQIRLMLQYIQEHYRETIRLEDIAAAVHLGKSTVMQIFHQHIHMSPIAYLIQYRVKRAAHLLRTTEKSVAAIADETGFESSTYFCRKFKELYRMTPTIYRKSNCMPCR